MKQLGAPTGAGIVVLLSVHAMPLGKVATVKCLSGRCSFEWLHHIPDAFGVMCYLMTAAALLEQPFD